MPSTRNDRRADRRRSAAPQALVAAACLAVAGAVPAAAQGDESRSDAVRMRDTAILGERPTPDIFFIVPTGKGGNLRAPHRRDYSGEILEPVVKPWLEKDQNVTLAGIDHVTTGGGNWREAFEAAPIAPSLPVPEPVLPAPRPAVGIPAAARTQPVAPAVPPPSFPSQARPAVPPPSFPPPAAAVPPPAFPPPAAAVPPPAPLASPAPPATGSGNIPILVPPQ